MVSLLDRWSARPLLLVVLAAVATVSIRLALIPVRGAPAPEVADEFSYLLGGDTFASGRLSNPPHPLAAAFESIHILVEPRYASKYQPGQALWLALGRRVLGSPFAGVVLSVAAMNAALCWMLLGWASPRWALLGTLFPVLFFTANQYWMESYWGGAVTAMGAALLLGALPRLLLNGGAVHGTILALGLGTLFLTRPYEGGILALTILIGAAPWLRDGVVRRRVFEARTLAAAFVILGAVVTFQALLNRSVSGSLLTLPYMLHDRIYQAAPPLWVLPAARPSRPAAREVERQHVAEYVDYQRIRSGLPAVVPRLVWRAAWNLLKICYPLVLLPLIGAAAWRRDPWLRLLGICAISQMAALTLEVWSFAHYDAALFVVVLCLLVRGLSQSEGTGSGRRRRWTLAAAIVLFAVVPLVRHAYVLRRDAFTPAAPRWSARRQSLARTLAESGGKHVVFVRYGQTHRLEEEWVYNAADIDAAPVVWARERDAATNARVVAYYGNTRRYWLIEPDRRQYEPQPYSPGQR